MHNHLTFSLRRCMMKTHCFYRAYHSSTGIYGYIPRAQKVTFQLPEKSLKNRIKNIQLYQLVCAYQDHGHKIAMLDPLGTERFENNQVLSPSRYGLDPNDETLYNLEGIMHAKEKQMKLFDIINLLKQVYNNCIGVEVQGLPEEEREWFTYKFENMQSESVLSDVERKKIAEDLIKSQVFDRFLATKFSNVKRYGAEGAESMMPFFRAIFSHCVPCDVSNVIIGIPHRGRLNLLTGLLNYPPVAMFQKMKGLSEFPASVRATGDVLSHLRISTDLEYDGHAVHVSMLPNPSHLEAVSPVVVGKARSVMQSLGYGDYSNNGDATTISKVLPIQVHGDASFSGQGVIMETIATSQVPHFQVGGSLHLVVNNQIGFTTPHNRGRSSLYCSDVMKMIGAPVIHVNGNFPEEVIKAALLALDYRQTFQKDVLVDLLCFRRWGHNELDDPMFTNPSMYKIIASHKSVPDSYCETLIAKGILSEKDKDAVANSYSEYLNENLKNVPTYKPPLNSFAGRWTGFKQASHSITSWDTGMPVDLLRFIGAKSVSIPDKMVVHPTLMKHFISERLKKLEDGLSIDWATAEALAIGSLLCQGHHVRLSGQDVGRGTFSHRHAMLIDQSTNEMYVPLNSMFEDQTGFLEVANSILSEEAVLSLEYGFSTDNPNHLVIWEAQFGDFFNAAQVVFDTFISSGETKWLLQSGIVILLPHGYDGAGPEHSSCRLERFLQMCDSKENEIDGDDVNWCVAFPTTPAQYFHLLRKQILCDYRRPLMLIAPKILLRHPKAISCMNDMSPGTTFSSVFGDEIVNPLNVKTIVFCSGKHYYLLKEERDRLGKMDTAIIRLEELCPFPATSLSEEIKKYKKASNFIWSQEEHRNMGPWSFVNVRFQNILNCKLRYAGRPPLATPAVGIGEIHQQEIKTVIANTFEEAK